MIKSWVFALPFYPGEFGEKVIDPDVCRDAYRWYLDLWANTEALGFEGVFFSEHHVPFHSLIPSPNILLAALAARTKTLRLGTLAYTLPMYAPWRLAEECAILDNLTGGRLEIGVARGASTAELAAAGIPAAEMMPRFEEGMELFVRCLTEQHLSFTGRFYAVDNFTLMPPPYQKPIPPLWIPVMSEASARAAAARGHRVCAGFHTMSAIARIFDGYRDSAGMAGRASGPDMLGIRRNVYVAESVAEADEILSFHKGEMLSRFEVLSNMVTPDEFICGTAGNVAEQIVAQCVATGAGHVVITKFETLSRRQVETSMDRYGRQVIPVLRTADLRAGGARSD